MLISTGATAPSFHLTAVESGRQVTTRAFPAAALVLLFHNQHTLAAVREVQEMARTRYPSAAEVMIASVADLSAVPRLLRGTVDRFLKAAYREGASHVPADRDPADYVIILPDWSGEISQAFGVGSVDRWAAVVALDPQGKVIGSHQGANPGAAVLAFLNSIMG